MFRAFFPAALIFSAAVVDLHDEDFDSVGSLLFQSYFFFFSSLYSLEVSLHIPCTVKYYEPQQKTLEAAWKEKFSYVHNERVSERRRKIIVEWEVYTHAEKKVQHIHKHTKVPLLLGPLPPCSPLAACLLNALVTAVCLSTSSSEKNVYFIFMIKTGSQVSSVCTQTTAKLYVFYFCTKSKVVDSLFFCVY